MSDASHLPPPQATSLPTLTNKATVYSGCCLALSAPLVEHLHSLLPRSPALVLSIGSGFGLLEAILNSPTYNAHIIGVEVEPSPNTYLPLTHHRAVHGSRFLEPLAAGAEAWMFVYPRRVGLISEYMVAHGRDKVHMIIWIGPQADWDDYKGCFAQGWTTQTRSADEIGGKAWDMVATVRRVSS